MFKKTTASDQEEKPELEREIETVKITVVREVETPKGKYCEGCQSVGFNGAYLNAPAWCKEFKTHLFRRLDDVTGERITLKCKKCRKAEKERGGHE